MPRGTSVSAWIGAKGFDTNSPVPDTIAKDFRAAGYSFAVRYVRREVVRSNDLTREEVKGLLNAGIAVMPVQHVESETAWTPSDSKGQLWGQNAVLAATECGIAAGTTLWLDLEGVAPGIQHEDIIRYCNYWYDRVFRAGFQPGIYVGWHARLTPVELYRRLKFTRYWGAFNLNEDQYPAVCGICMKQGVPKPRDLVPTFRWPIDTNKVVGDKLGRVPTMFAPDEWGIVGFP